MFTTKDQDNDDYGKNCAAYVGGNGGWWYGICSDANLNGPYRAGPVNNLTALYWATWPSNLYSLKKSTMMIKDILKDHKQFFFYNKYAYFTNFYFANSLPTNKDLYSSKKINIWRIEKFCLKYCGRICLSCSGVESVGECSDVEICADDEFCVSGNSGSVFGKRLTGHHILCHNCCNNTNVCNIRSLCGSDTCSSHQTKDSKLPRECDDLSNVTTGINTIYPDGINPVQVYCIVANNEKWTLMKYLLFTTNCGRTCLSCSGVVSVRECTELEVCGNDEFCLSAKSGLVFGKRGAGHHLVCQTCCNGTDICNIKSSCESEGSCITSPSNVTKGNYYIHQISSSTGHKLSIYLEDFTEHFVYANFSLFDLGNQHRKYQLTIDKFAGSSGISDYLTGAHNTNMFSTKDQDNDNYGNNCAETHSKGGWWYGSCLNVNLNGPYMAGPVHNKSAMYWYGWPSSYYSLKKSTMMIKRISERP
ncbi:unnamed protein product [Mytilus edulis]|uniref:Fibrinogen C-terminal domain-containing protein n=1 Tax=Mytilus edulis TaxID=6550 RepID=A0A8S3QQF1_MYTED|nr:unnamed protein product [Mytilus edulis]